MEYFICSMHLRLAHASYTHEPPRPRQVISAINIPLSVMMGPVLACRLVRGLVLVAPTYL